MAYRVEAAKSGRAVCRDSHCKREAVQIAKGEPRFGTWLDLGDFASFQWKHWGCVTGYQMENLRKYLLQGDPDGPYQWEFMDGLEDMDEDFKRKFKTAVIEGKIADEDWNGDPEYNRLGQKGTRARYKKPTVAAENEDDDAQEIEPSPKAAPKKRARPKKETGDDEEEIKPAKKRATKAKTVKTEDDADSGDYNEKKARKAGKGKKPATDVKDKHDVDTNDQVEAKPVKRAQAKKDPIKAEADQTFVDIQKEKLANPLRGKKATSKVPQVNEAGDTYQPEPVGGDPQAKKSMVKSKREKIDNNIKEEPTDGVEFDIKPKKKGSGKNTVKKEDKTTAKVKAEEAKAGDSSMSARGRRAAKRGDVDADGVMARDDTKPAEGKRGRKKKVKIEQGSEEDPSEDKNL